MGRLALDGLLGIHTNLLTPALGDAEALERVATHQRRTCCPRPARRIPRDRHGLLRGAGDAPGDDWLRPAGFTHRPGGLDDRSRYGQLPKDRPRLRRQATLGQSHPRTHRRQHHAVLVDTAPGPRRRARTGRKDKRTLVRPARLPRRSRFRSASPRSPGRSGGPRAAGSSGHTPTSTSTSTRSTRAATSPPGRNRSSSRKRCAPRSPPCDSRVHQGPRAEARRLTGCYTRERQVPCRVRREVASVA